MRFLRSTRFLAFLAVVLVAGTAAAVAIPAVISSQTLASTSNVHLEISRRVADGFDSGWHIHPGIVLVQVQEGALQITQGSCTPKTVAAGDTYIEVPHLAVRAVATGRVVWTSTLITNGADPVQIAWSVYSPGSPNPCP